jgi:hypothetical protein
MAQDFERLFLTGVGTTAQDLPDGSDFNSDDTIIGINMANTSANAITASCFMTSSVLSYGADFTFAVTAAGGNFLIDGQTKPALTLYKGFTYTFDVSHSSNSGHVLRFATQAEGANSSIITAGVTATGTPGQANAKVVIVTSSTTASTIYYYCTNHSGMGNSITVTDVHYIIKDAPIPSGSALQLLDGGAKMVVQNNDRMFFQSNTASSLDVWLSRVDSIST